MMPVSSLHPTQDIPLSTSLSRHPSPDIPLPDIPLPDIPLSTSLLCSSLSIFSILLFTVPSSRVQRYILQIRSVPLVEQTQQMDPTLPNDGSILFGTSHLHHTNRIRSEGGRYRSWPNGLSRSPCMQESRRTIPIVAYPGLQESRLDEIIDRWRSINYHCHLPREHRKSTSLLGSCSTHQIHVKTPHPIHQIHGTASVVHASVVHKTVVHTPVVQTPVVHTPVVHTPVVHTPVVYMHSRPHTSRPHTSRPCTSHPHTSRPHTSRPHTSRPHTSRPHTSRPHTSRPHTSRPCTSRPHTSRPHTSRPHTSRPCTQSSTHQSSMHTSHPHTSRPYTSRPHTSRCIHQSSTHQSSTHQSSTHSHPHTVVHTPHTSRIFASFLLFKRIIFHDTIIMIQYIITGIFYNFPFFPIFCFLPTQNFHPSPFFPPVFHRVVGFFSHMLPSHAAAYVSSIDSIHHRHLQHRLTHRVGKIMKKHSHWMSTFIEAPAHSWANLCTCTQVFN